MKIILTGSAGILGSQLHQFLSTSGHSVTALDLTLGHDLTNETFITNFFREHRGDAIINAHVLNDHVVPGLKRRLFFDCSYSEFLRILDVNVASLFAVCSAYIKNNQHGRIINFSSIYGHRVPDPSMYDGGHKSPAYCVSKAAVGYLGKYLASHAPKFRVNTIVCGGVYNRQSAEFVSKYNAKVPVGRMMTPEEVIGLVTFLLSNDSDYCTGGEFFIDGGYCARS
jgi:NAD(P)-dependent dehydrogenase (short-subunit alcohol dehydrogenase family)